MKNLLSLGLLFFALAMTTSCSESDLPVDSVRDYRTDAQILTKFVDINKTIGEYYINEHKKNSPLSYVSDKDYQELQLVNPANKTRFENDLKALNAQLAATAQRLDVSQMVYSTYSETWIREIEHDAPFKIEKSTLTESAMTRSSYGRLGLLYNSEQRQSFNAGNRIYSRIDINLFSYTYYYFEIICDTNASKSGPGSGGSNPKSIVMSGTTMMDSYQFTWTENSGSSSVAWQFRGKRFAPQDFNAQITTEFYD